METKKEVREKVWRRMTEKYSGMGKETIDVINWLNRNLKPDVDSLENEAVNMAIEETQKKMIERLDYALKSAEHDYKTKIYFPFENLKEYLEEEAKNSLSSAILKDGVSSSVT